MSGILEGIVKGLSGIMPQDDPDVKIFNAQNNLEDLTQKEEVAYARLGRQIYESDGAERFPELKAELERLGIEKVTARQCIQAAKEEKAAKERAEAEEATRREEEEVSRCCPNCGNYPPEGTNFCQECGSKLSAPVSAGKRFCPNCGMEIAAGNHFCGSCGTKVE